GRHDGRDRRPERPLPPRQEFAGTAPSEPVILPGESLAKYRSRIAPPAQAPEASPTEPLAPETPAAVRPAEAAPKAEVALTAPPIEAPTAEELAAAEPEPVLEKRRVAAEPAPTAKEPEAPPAAPAAPEGVTAGESPVVPPAAEVYPDAVTLAEIQRVRQYEDQVGLPPSVQERTAGGVEWQQRGGRGRRRGGRFRRGRGRRGPGPQGRGPEPQGRRERRPQHARPTRGQPPIAELLRAGQEITVQIAKEQMGKKGARITSHVTLPGRFLVYMPTIDHIGISRRIGTSEERSRLRRLLLELKGSISGGFVVRTAATGCSEEDLRQDIDYLVKLWHDIRVRAEESPAPVVLHSDLNLVERILRDQLTNDYESVWIDNEEEYAEVLEFVGRFQPNLARRVKLYTKTAPIFEEMGVQQEIDRALRPKVWLKSGGYIVINHTEALVAIDVNTGKFVGKGSTRLEDTIVKTNLEAVQEIVRQIRLRDLGGIIIIDFIDMEDSRNRYKVMRALEDALRSDRSPSKLLSFNEFGLVAITRKRSRQSLERVLCQPCPTCTGTGMVKSAETLCYEIQWETRKMAAEIDAPELTIRAHPDIVKALKSGDHALVHELEEQTGKNIILHSDNALHFTEYNIY
ncbi:MAG TPA: Rne/Rng family ribonuclease, partial [Candidatus Acidoferrales bacterium]|nr:Rne/Rng family ribonuclease [Candidatus Acidoferrales bacterium]